MQASDQMLTTQGLTPLSVKVLAIREEVFSEWEKTVRLLVPGAAQILPPILINTLPVFYDNIAQSLSPNYPREQATSNNTIAAAHGSERARMTSYGPDQVIHEYQIFRKVFKEIVGRNNIELNIAEWVVFDESIDSAIREAVKEFSTIHDTFRQQMVASLSHDMRNPLTVLVNAAELLRLQGVNQAPKKTALIKKILDNGSRLSGMIEKLLDDISSYKGDKLPLTMSEFDVHELLKTICSEFSSGTPISYKIIGEPIKGYWCMDSLRRAVENLLSNAAKYGDGKEITIKVDQVHQRIVLSVHNTGPHITQDIQNQIFEYLWREREDENIKGWGIGLPFVKSVAESHGGSVAVDSAPEVGTTFLIDIPVDCRRFS